MPIVVGAGLVIVVLGVVAWPGADRAERDGDGRERAAGEATPALETPRPTAADVRAREAAAAARELVMGPLGAKPSRGAPLARLLAYREALREARSELDRFDAADLDPKTRQALLTRLDRAEAAAAERAERAAAKVWNERREAVDTFLGVENFDRALTELEHLPEGFDRTSWAERVGEERARIEAARRHAAEASATVRDEGWDYVPLALRGGGWHTDDALRWTIDLGPDREVRSIEARERTGETSWLVWDGRGARRWSRLRFDLRLHERGVVLLLGTGASPENAARIAVRAGEYPRSGDWTRIEVVDENGRWTIRLGPRRLRRVTKREGGGPGIGFESLVGSWFEIRNVRVR